ncbi:MAG: hypothetical protein K2X27_15805 [Candidatus Obscuribacterales bacterium]|nr:hypothetical protein [Candidatus Obscuribacterales bacterium]
MFLSRREGLLGDNPALGRSIPAAFRRRNRRDITYGAYPGRAERSPDSAKSHEVRRLFARMRSELLDIELAFNKNSDAEAGSEAGLFAALLNLSEELASEIDAELALICLVGGEAERNSSEELLEQMQNSARVFLALQSRLLEFQNELFSMLELNLQLSKEKTCTSLLNFAAIEAQSSMPLLGVFLEAVESSIKTLTDSTISAIQLKDFEFAAEICSCNLQLSNFLTDTQRIAQSIR